MQLRIGFFVQKCKEWNPQSFILIEIFDNEKFEFKKEEKDIVEYKNRMLASISHELRTPLNCSIQML